MALLSPSKVNGIKSIADKTIGNLNKGTRYLLDLFDAQNKNQFEMLIYPASLSFSFSMDTLKKVAMAALATLITRIHIQSITFSFPSIEYETYNEVKAPKDIVFPEQVTMTLVENEIGVVRNFLNYWINLIIKPNSKFGYVFADDQERTKMNAIIIPLMGIGIPSTAWVKLEGLKYKSTGEITLAQGDGDPMTIEVICSVDNVRWKALSGLL